MQVGLGFHAVPQDEGVFDIDRFRRHKYSKQFSGLTLESVSKQVQAFRRQGGEEESNPPREGAIPSFNREP